MCIRDSHYLLRISDSGPGINLQDQSKLFRPFYRGIESGQSLQAKADVYKRQDLVFYGTLDRWLKAVDAQTGKEHWKFQVGSGVIGNAFTYGQKGKQYVGVLSGIGGWAGVAMNLGMTNDTDAFGAAGGYKELTKYNAAPGGGALNVFSL